MVKFAQKVQYFSQNQKQEGKKEMKRTLRQSTALLLAMLMVFSSVGMILGLAVDDEPAAPVWPEGYRVVDGSSDEDLWVSPVEGNLDYSFAYNFAMDADSLIFYFVTATANLKTGYDVFRVWLRDNAEATAYTDFVTVKESGGQYVLSSAKYNKELHSNSGENWDEYLTAAVVISAESEGDYTYFTVDMPLDAFDGLENQTYIDAWVSLWPNGTEGYTCLHSGVGGAPTGGTASWNPDADYTYSWATVDGQFDESCWEDGWTTVDGVNVGQWQASDSTKEGFSYDYKFYFSTEYLYLGVVYNQAPSFYYNSQTNASNIRIWFADTQTTATGKFDGLVDVRYTGLTAEAIVAERTTDAVDIDETKVVVGDAQDENSWSVEIAIPLSELGLLGWDDSTYYGLGLTVSDPFGECEGSTKPSTYGALVAHKGFSYTDRTTWEKFFPNGAKYPEYNGNPVLPSQSVATNIAREDGVETSYPTGYAQYTADLFDGVAASTLSYDNNWFAFYQNSTEDDNMTNHVGSVTIDLGKTDTGIGAFRANIFTGSASGILAPKAVKVYASVDEVSWLAIGEMSYDAESTVQWAELILDEEIDARYIRIDFEANGVFAFVNEIEVIHYDYYPSFAVDFANQYAVGYQDPNGWVYNGGESLAGVGDAVYLYTAGGKTLKEVTGSNFAWWNVWTVAYDFDAGVYKITDYQAPAGASDKGSVVIPQYGFVVASCGNGNKTLPSGMISADSVGKSLYVYGINIATLGDVRDMAFKNTNLITFDCEMPGRTDLYTPVVELEFTAGEGSMEVEAGYAPIEILLDGDKTEITGYENNKDKLYTIKNLETANAIDYTLTRRFGEEVAISKITMSLLNYTAGNIGLPTSIVVNINGTDYTAVNVTNKDGAVNDYVVEFDIAVVAEEFIIKVSHPAGAVKRNSWTEIAVESDIVALPEGAITIDNIGYKHAATVSIFAGNGTITEIAGKDNNYAKVITVNKYGFVTGTYFTLGDYSKGNVQCPEGGFVISYNANKAGYEKMDAIKVGDYIRLYNVDTSLFGNYSGQDDYDVLVNAGFTVTSVGSGVTNLSDPNEIKIDSTGKLTDGKYGEAAGAWGTGTGDVLLIQNLNPTDASINPTVKLLLKLDAKQAISVLKLGFYHDKNSMIGLPKDNQIRISVSTDGLNFTALDTYTLTSEAAVGKFGTEVFSANALNAEALYVMLEYEIGPSGFEGKVVDEFTAMTEFYVGAFEAFVPVDDTVVADDEAKTLMMDDKTTVADLLAAIGDSEGKLYSVTDSKGSKLSADALVGTGAVVTELVSGAAEKYTAIVRGDVNGDGKLTATDYLLVKKAVLKLDKLEGVYLEAAACFNGEDGLTASDYLMMKKAILGID
jgi:hypothetical protein